MKKILATLFLFSCLLGNAVAQELSQQYLALCNEFLGFLREEQRFRQTGSTYICIWSPPEKDDSFSIFIEAPYDLEQAPAWVCYQSPCLRVGRPMADGVMLPAEEVAYMCKTWSAKQNVTWRNKLAAATGILADEPWVTHSATEYPELSAPLFLQDNTVCVVYREYNSLYARGGAPEF